MGIANCMKKQLFFVFTKQESSVSFIYIVDLNFEENMDGGSLFVHEYHRCINKKKSLHIYFGFQELSRYMKNCRDRNIGSLRAYPGTFLVFHFVNLDTQPKLNYRSIQVSDKKSLNLIECSFEVLSDQTPPFV